jgi:hypothetical protein
MCRQQPGGRIFAIISFTGQTTSKDILKRRRNWERFRDELAKQMTPEQLAEAQKRTEKFWSDMKK